VQHITARRACSILLDEEEEAMTHPQWIDWAQRLQAIAQSGLAYSPNVYDRERYEILRGIAAEMLAAAGQIELPVVQQLIDAEAGYATPKIDIRGVVFQEDKILLVRELADGGWTLPGGWVDVNEPPSRAVEREVWEESGYQVRAVKLLAVFDRNLHGHTPFIFHTYKLYLRCDLTGGHPVDSYETDGARFFGPDELPPLSISRTTPEVLDRMFAHYHHPDWPTDFD
jgi:ADP-ribose pyrophosphatase YjhB (NUDIX family)